MKQLGKFPQTLYNIFLSAKKNNNNKNFSCFGMFLQVLGNSLRESKQIELKACQICWEKIKIEINLPTTRDDEHR